MWQCQRKTSALGIKYLTVLVAIIPQFYITLTEGRVGLLEGLSLLLSGGLITGICICGRYVLKYLVVRLICKTPELSDEKAKAITEMISKDSKFSL